MISVGSNIQSISDELQKVSIGYLAEKTIKPQANIEAKIRRLRLIRNIDAKQYTRLKRELPYFVCASFSPPYRRTENFAYTEYFVIDLDHLSQHGYEPGDLKKRISKDSRVHLIFTSPSEDGLKIIFKLSERCYDAGIYSIFYKAFCNHLAAEYNISDIIDFATHDVCRACFISFDADAYYNPLADSVNMSAYIDSNNPNSLFEIKREIDKIAPAPKSPQEHVSEPEPDILEKIKEKLKERTKNVKTIEKDIFVPEQVERIINRLSEFVSQFQIELYETVNIQYGKKLRFKIDSRKAELNLFFGKRGYTVVQSPRSGTSSELNNICHEIVKQFIREIT